MAIKALFIVIRCRVSWRGEVGALGCAPLGGPLTPSWGMRRIGLGETNPNFDPRVPPR
jgi:hypothetical protein